MVQTQQALRQAQRSVSLQQRQVARKAAARHAIAMAKQSVKQTEGKVNYKAAWDEAKKHFEKGKGGAYLQHMEKESLKDPQIGAVYGYIKELQRQKRAGNISPGRQKGSLLATPKEVAKQKANIEFIEKYEKQKAEKFMPEIPAVRAGEIQPTPTITRETYGPKKPSPNERQFYSMMNIPSSDRKGQIYDPKTRMYTKPAYGSGYGGTAIITPPTTEEKTKIEAAEYAGSLERATKDIKSGIEKYKEKVVIPLSESTIFKEYKEKVVAPVSEYFVEPLKEKTKIAVKEYKEKVVIPLRQSLPSLGETPIGQIAETKRYIETVSPEKKIIVGLPGQRRVVEAGKYQKGGLWEFGKDIYLGEVETAFTDIAKTAKVEKPEYYGKAARFTSEFGAYAVPGYFASDIVIPAGEAVSGGKFGGPKDIVGFVKEKPVEIAIAASFGLGKGYKVLRGISKTPKQLGEGVTKYDKYIEAKRIERIIEPEYKRVAIQRDIYGKQLKKVERTSEDILYGAEQVTRKKKGVVSILVDKPTGKLKGEIVEKVKGGWFTKDKIIKGKVLGTEAGLTETIELGKGLKKITRTSKSGEGSVSIVKDGKLVKRVKFKGDTPSSAGFKPYIDEPIKQTKKMQIGEEGKWIDKKSIDYEKAGDDSLLKLRTDKKVPKKKQPTIFGEEVSKGDIKYKVDKKVGTIDILKTEERTIDILKASTKKEVESAKGGDFAYIKKIETSQPIAYEGEGTAKVLDSTRFTKIGGVETLLKTTQPTIERKIIQQQKWKLVTKYVDDVKLPTTPKKKPSKPIWDEKTIAKDKADLKLLKQEIKQEDKLLLKEKSKPILYVPRPQKYVSDTPISIPELPVIPGSIVSPKLVQKTPKLEIVGGTSTSLPTATTTQVKTTTLETTQPQVTSFNGLSAIQEQKPKVEVKQEQRQVLIKLQPQVEITKTIQKPKQIEILKSEVTQIQAQKSMQDVAKISRLGKAQLQQQAQTQAQSQQQLQPQLQKTKPKPKPIAKTSSLIKSLAVKAEKGELFEVFARKGGKDVVVAKAKTEKEAFKKLKKKLRGTLRASGFVQKSGKKIAPPILLNGDFRKSKVDSFRVVEKKGKRLRKRTTGKEVQMFRAFGIGKEKKKTGFFGF